LNFSVWSFCRLFLSEPAMGNWYRTGFPHLAYTFQSCQNLLAKLLYQTTVRDWWSLDSILYMILSFYSNMSKLFDYIASMYWLIFAPLGLTTSFGVNYYHLKKSCFLYSRFSFLLLHKEPLKTNLAWKTSYLVIKKNILKIFTDS